MATWGLYGGTVCLDNALRKERECFLKIRNSGPRPLKEFAKDYYHWIVAKSNLDKCNHSNCEKTYFGCFVSWPELQSLLLHKELWPKRLRDYYVEHGLLACWGATVSEWEVQIEAMKLRN